MQANYRYTITANLDDRPTYKGQPLTIHKLHPDSFYDLIDADGNIFFAGWEELTQIKEKPTAADIFKKGFQYKTIGEMNADIRREKETAIREWRSGRNIVTGSGGNSILICDTKGERMHKFEEPNYTRTGTITKKEIISVIDSLIYYFDGKLPAFELASDDSLYYWDNVRDKFEGIEKEPTGAYYGVTILVYAPE